MLVGIPLNLLFCWTWTIVFPPTIDEEDGKQANIDDGTDINKGDQNNTTVAAAEPVKPSNAEADEEQVYQEE